MNMRPASEDFMGESDAWMIKEAILDELGEWVFEQMCEKFGGQEIAIPSGEKALDPDHFPAAAIGQENAQILADEVGPARYYVPMRTPTAAPDALRLMREGLANWEIGQRLDVSERHVRRLLAAQGVSNPNRKSRRPEPPREATCRPNTVTQVTAHA